MNRVYHAKNDGERAAKRIFDITLAAIGLILSSPVVLVCAAAIKLSSPGPAIFRQTRIGRNGTTFICLKLRTMRANTPNVPSHQTGPVAITPLGYRLRRLKVDELPQLWNVIRGDMSLVGPRPCLPTQIELINARKGFGVDRIRPGITGVAQVAGLDMSEPEKLAAMDATYLSDMTIKSDCAVLLRTVLGVFRRNGSITDAANRAS